MRILFVTQYFTPETGAASERLSGMAIHLSKLGHNVTVITAFPNYPFGKIYPGYRRKLFSVEKIQGVRVVRVWLFTTPDSRPFARLANYLSFLCSSILAGLWTGGADCVVATSGPLFAALAGYVLSRVKKTRFYFDVRDIWPERIYAGTNMKRGALIKVLEKLELFLYRKSAGIVAVTQGVRNNIVSKGVSAEKVTVITNGVDSDIFFPQPKNGMLAEKLGIRETTFTVIYVGTLGLLQDLSLIAACAERLKPYGDIMFLIVGSGAKRDEFVSMIKSRGLANVKVLPAVPQRELCDYVNLSNLGINANTAHPHNMMALPVKMFPYMACAKPVVFANGGEVASLIEKYEIGQCVPPGDVEAFAGAILKFYHDRELCFRCGENGYALVNEQFTRDKLSRKLAGVLSSGMQRI